MNTFLDAIDGSYCNYSAYGETGNDPHHDPIYPDTNHTNGYKGELQCGVYTPPKVFSVSYGAQEDWIPYYYLRRQCNEFLKLGLQGVTAVFSSDDWGVGLCPEHGRVFVPDVPGACP
jgi:tripeptidyl-peptidase-1